MRILHVSNFGDKHNGRLYWNQCFKITNGFIRNGHNVYNFSDRDRSRSSIFNKFKNNETVQKELLQTIENYNPSLIVLGHADRINIETLSKIKAKKDIKIIEWNVDNFYLDNTLKKLSNRSEFLDGIFSTTADEQISKCVYGNFISFFPNIVDASIEKMKIYENINHPKDVFFALSHGVGTGKLRRKNSMNENKDPRVKFMDNLKFNLSDIKFNFFGMRGVQPIWASEFDNNIKDCYMGICLQRKPILKYSLSDRIAQYLGNGLMVFIESDTQYYDILKKDEEAVYFDGVEDLAEKIDFYKKNKDKALNIAANGHKKIHSTCNEKIITQYMLDCLCGNDAESLKSNYQWPINLYR
tara:strand:- start:134 stop:1198 length:1065 start_codon:yes stop_codon:yes gene_type:complete